MVAAFQDQGSSPPRSGGEVARAKPETERGPTPSRRTPDDGSQHADSAYDRKRDEFMRGAGYSVLRIWNVDVLKEIDAVCAAILAALDGRLSEDTVAADMRFVFASGGRRER